MLTWLQRNTLTFPPLAKAMREQGEVLFRTWEKPIFAAVLVAALGAAYALYSGAISL